MGPPFEQLFCGMRHSTCPHWFTTPLVAVQWDHGTGTSPIPSCAVPGTRVCSMPPPFPVPCLPLFWMPRLWSYHAYSPLDSLPSLSTVWFSSVNKRQGREVVEHGRCPTSTLTPASLPSHLHCPLPHPLPPPTGQLHRHHYRSLRAFPTALFTHTPPPHRNLHLLHTAPTRGPHWIVLNHCPPSLLGALGSFSCLSLHYAHFPIHRTFLLPFPLPFAIFATHDHVSTMYHHTCTSHTNTYTPPYGPTLPHLPFTYYHATTRVLHSGCAVSPAHRLPTFTPLRYTLPGGTTPPSLTRLATAKH